MVSDLKLLSRAGVSNYVDISRGIETSTKSVIWVPREIPYSDLIVKHTRYLPRIQNQHKKCDLNPSGEPYTHPIVKGVRRLPRIQNQHKKCDLIPSGEPYTYLIVKSCRYLPRDRNQHNGLWS